LVCYNQILDTERVKVQENKSSKSITVFLVILAVIVIGGIVAGIYFLAAASPETTGQVRDIFIIVLALESLLIGIALIILVLQLAVFTNIIQNEVRPILESTRETVGTVKGTSQFISKRAVAPIIAVTSLLAGIRKAFDIIGFVRKEKNKE